MADQISTFTNTLQSGAVAVGNGTEYDVGGLSVLSAQISGLTTATITWEGTVNDSDWVALTAANVGTLVTAQTATTNGIYMVPIAGLSKFRARISAYTSGTITVRVKALQLGDAPVSIQSLSMPDEGQQTMANSISVAIASNQTVLGVGGEVAHDAADSGNPAKIGGKALTALPTAVTTAARVNALFDEYGRLYTREGSPVQTISRAGVAATDGAQVNSSAINIAGKSLYLELNVTVTGGPGSVASRIAVEGSLDGTNWHQLVRFTDCTSTTADARVARLSDGPAGTEIALAIADMGSAAASPTILGGPLPVQLRLVTKLQTLTGGASPTVSYTLRAYAT